MANKNLPWIIAGGSVAAFLLLRSTPSTAVPGASVLSSLLPSAGTGTVIVDALGNKVTRQPTPAENAGLTNPNYQLTAQNLTDYYNNYLDLQQAMGAGGWIAKYGSLNAALQQHWTQNGVTDHRDYMPLVSRSTVPYTPPASGGGGFLSSALSVVTTVAPYAAAILGIGSVSDSSINNLTGGDIDLLITGQLVAKEILDMYGSTAQTVAISNKMNDVVNSIT